MRRVQNSSNGELFERAANNVYGPEFPEDVRILLTAAWNEWFQELRKIRTELTHGCVGTCHLDAKTKQISYFNEGIIDRNIRFKDPDIEEYLRKTERKIRELIESICRFHFLKLDRKPHFAICGWYLARYYARMVSPDSNLNWDDGHCLSYEWFEKTPDLFCPMASRCGAYTRKWPGGLTAALSE